MIALHSSVPLNKKQKYNETSKQDLNMQYIHYAYVYSYHITWLHINKKQKYRVWQTSIHEIYISILKKLFNYFLHKMIEATFLTLSKAFENINSFHSYSWKMGKTKPNQDGDIKNFSEIHVIYFL